MRRLQHLRSARGATRETRRRGRGRGSGRGGTCCRGHKGQNSRENVKPWFEGGQMPIQRRMGHKGFNNARFAVRYQIVNVDNLQRFPAETVVDPDGLKEAGLVSSRFRPVKILGRGELDRALTVRAHRFSASAEKAITDAGGAAEVIE